MNNNFSQKDRDLFFWNYTCWECGQNTADALHHVVGRGSVKNSCESSPLNAAPICNFKCHIPRCLNDSRSDYLKKTFYYITTGSNDKYKLTEKDFEFVEKYKEYYETEELRKINNLKQVN